MDSPEGEWFMYAPDNATPHNPMWCSRWRRYLAHGGETANTPEEKAFCRSCLHYWNKDRPQQK